MRPRYLEDSYSVIRFYHVSLTALAAAVALFGSAPRTQSVPIRVRVYPATPLIERGRDQQLLNFDIAVTSDDNTPLKLRRIQLSAYDDSGALITRRNLDENGFPSSIETLPNRDLPAHGELGIFNPFYGFSLRSSISMLRYELFFTGDGGVVKTVSFVVHPQVYNDKTSLMVPLKGRLFVDDGHDFYGHHRRQDITLPQVAAMGVIANTVRYADDFVFVDEHGAMYHGNPLDKNNWYGYGKPVYAPAAGRVAATVNDVGEPSWDGHHVHRPKLPPDASPFGMGNYVIIDHGNGEFSALVHLIPGSIRVKRGQHVAQGERIAALGTSDAGDPTHPVEPHLHYSLMRGVNFPTSEGLPAYFEHFTLLDGKTAIPISNGAINTGDFFKT